MSKNTVSVYVNLVDEDIVLLWQERSSIMEQENGWTRELADKRAYYDLRNLIGTVPVPQTIRDAVRKEFK